MGLGAYHAVSLSSARKQALDARELIQQKIDPREQREQQIFTARIANNSTLLKVAEMWFEIKKTEVSPDYAEDVWRSLQLHIFPRLGEVSISQL